MVDALLRSDLAGRVSMRFFNTYRPRDPRRALAERLRYQWGMIRALRRELVRHPVDLVHLHASSGVNFHQNAFYSLVARLSGVPVVFQMHCGMFESFYRTSPAPIRAWIRWILTRATRVAVLSRAWYERMSDLFPHARRVLVTNGLEECEIGRLEVDRSPGPSQVLFVGAGHEDLNRDKGLDDLLAVLPEVARRHPDASWVIAGLPHPEEVRRRQERQGLAGSLPTGAIRYLGIVEGEEKDALLRESTILVLPSYFESMPILILEAMAAGLSVVATRLGAIPEMLGEGRGGLLVSPGDRAGLQRALDELLSCPSLAGDQGRRNRVAVHREYTLERMQKTLEDLYREAAGWPARRAAAEIPPSISTGRAVTGAVVLPNRPAVRK